MTQVNTDVEDGQLAKYEVGAYLVFVNWSRGEIPGRDLRAGAVLRVALLNGGGMGIIAANVATGIADMVWPEEVLVLGDQDLVAARRVARRLRRARARR